MKYLVVRQGDGKIIRIPISKRRKRRVDNLRGPLTVLGRHKDAWGKQPRVEPQNTSAFLQAIRFKVATAYSPDACGKYYISLSAFSIDANEWFSFASWEDK
jgi:hypothetical protein